MTQSGSDHPSSVWLLMQAIADNNLEQVNALLDSGVNPNAACCRDNCPDLASIVDPKYRLLLQRFRNSLDVYRNSITPLYWAVEFGHYRIVEALLEKSADPNTQSAGGMTPLHVWVYRIGQPISPTRIQEMMDIGKALLNKGADPNISNIYGDTPFDLYMGHSHLSQEMVSMLIDKGADPYYKDWNRLSQKLGYFPDSMKQPAPSAWIVGLLNRGHALEEFPLLFKNASLFMIAALIDYAVAHGRSDVLYDFFTHYNTWNKLVAHTSDWQKTTVKIVNCLRKDSLLDEAQRKELLEKLKVTDPAITIEQENKSSSASLHHAYLRLQEPLDFFIPAALLESETELKDPAISIEAHEDPDKIQYDTLSSDEERQKFNRDLGRRSALEHEAKTRRLFLDALGKSNIHAKLNDKNAKINNQSILHLALNATTTAPLADLVFFLLKGANPNALDDKGKKPIDYLKSEMNGHKEILEKGIDYFIQPENIERLRQMLLEDRRRIAASQENDNKVETDSERKNLDDFLEPLIRDYPLVKDINGDILLHRLILKKEPERAYALIESGLMQQHLDVQNNMGNTALHLAVLNKDINTVNQLLVRGAKKTILNNNNKTPLDIAISWQNLDMIDRFLVGVVDLDIAIIKKIFRLAVEGNHIDIINKLIDGYREKLTELINHDLINDLILEKKWPILIHLLKFNIIDTDFIKKYSSFVDTLISAAITTNNNELLALLLDKGYLNTESFFPALCSACKNNKSDLVDTLLAKCDPSILLKKDNYGNTLLHYAAEGGNKDLVETLLNQGADPNSQNNDGYSPVHKAVTQMKAAAVDILLKRGGDPLQDSTYKIICFIPFISSTPVDFAIGQNRSFGPLSERQNTLLQFNFLSGINNFLFRAIRLQYNKGQKHLDYLLSQPELKLADLPGIVKKPYPELLKAMIDRAINDNQPDVLHKIFINNYTDEQFAFLKNDRKFVDKISHCLTEAPSALLDTPSRLAIFEKLQFLCPTYLKSKNHPFFEREAPKKPAPVPPKKNTSNP